MKVTREQVAENRRTILEGMPDNGEHGPGPEIPRGAPKGERPVAGTARRLTQAGWLPGLRKSIARRVRPWCAMNARRVRPVANRERRLHAGHGMPRRVPRMHPSATGAPPTPRWG